MALWVNETCLRCKADFGTTQESLSRSLHNKDKYRICPECQDTKSREARDNAKQEAWQAANQLAQGFVPIAGDLRDAAVIKVLIRRVCEGSLSKEAQFWRDVKKEIES